MNRKQLIQALVPIFYDIQKKPAENSYHIKHDLEYGVFARPDKFYFGNTETIEALVEMGIPHKAGPLNYLFALKPKFHMDWLRNEPPSQKPKYTRTTEWEAFLAARKACDELVADLLKHDTSEDDRFRKLAKVVGYWEVPASQIEKYQDAWGSRGKQQSSPIHSSRQDD